jgi:hypothetical protein
MNFRHLLPTAAVVTLLSTSSALAGPLTLTCAPGQRAVVRETLVRGAPVTSAECVNTSESRGYYTQARYRTSGYQETRYRTSRPHRSWGKTALTIAGGGATGAGIGGIVNGKKGALIGTALGAGAASLYESVKRR